MADEEKKSTKLDVAGTYQVAILDEPKWYEMKAKDGDTVRMELLLKGYVNGGEQDGQWIFSRLMFTRKIYGAGQNKGRTTFSVSADVCLTLGMSDPFSPSKVSEMVGATCEFVVDWEEYEGKNRLKVKWLNTDSRPPMAADAVENVWKQLQEDTMGGDSDLGGADLGDVIAAGDDLLGGGIDAADDVPFGNCPCFTLS